MHYAILPVYTPEEAAPTYENIRYKGNDVLACKTDEGYILERVYSTNPKDFLDPELSPGVILENSLIDKIV